MLKRLLCAFVITAPTVVSAQTSTATVTFTEGIVGTIGSSTNSATNVVNLGNIGISAIFSQESTATDPGTGITIFAAQGNDVCGQLTLTGTSIPTFDACINWRASGDGAGSTNDDFVGIIAAESVAFSETRTYTGSVGTFNGQYTILALAAGAAATPESSYLFKLASNQPDFADGSDVGGNAAQGGTLDALNAFLLGQQADTTKPEITGPTAGTTNGEGEDAIEVAEGTTAVTQFTSNEEVTWTLDGTDAALFEIDADGNLTFVNAPVFDAETPENNVYVVEIVATDDAGNEAILTFTVTVTDATKPEIDGPTDGTTDGVGSDAIEVAEGTTEVTQFTSGEEVEWSVGGPDAGLFDIDDEGNLSFLNAAVFDPQNPANNVYEIEIVATDLAGNAAVLTFTITVTDTALAALNRNRDDIEAIIAEVELQKLRAEQRSLRKMTSQARDRLAGGACGEEEEQGGASANDEACQDYNRTRMNGQANDDGMTLSGSNASMATFDGYRRLTSLTIDMARSDRVETLTFSGRFALESTRFENALYGVFVGAKMNNSDVNRRLSGDVKSWGLSFGAYAVNRLSSNVYSEAYLSVGRSKTDLALGIAAEDFTVDADYTGAELHGGWILSGVVERGDWEFLPEVGVQLAQSKTGPISVAAAIPGDTATDTWAGLTVSMARANVATDIRYHLGGKADDSWVANFKPGIVCERTKAIDTRSGCGAAAQLGLNYHSADGMTRFSAGVDVERIKTDDRASMGMDVEFRF